MYSLPGKKTYTSVKCKYSKSRRTFHLTALSFEYSARQKCRLYQKNVGEEFVGALKFKLVAPMPAQLKTNTSICLLTPQGNALLLSQFVLGWMQRNSNVGFSYKQNITSFAYNYTSSVMLELRDRSKFTTRGGVFDGATRGCSFMLAGKLEC